MAYNMQGTCWHCGQKLQERDYGRESRCPGCDKPTHVCRNCGFYSPSAPGQCREPVADAVSDKQRANFCGYFEATDSYRDEASDAQALRQAADDLFDF